MSDVTLVIPSEGHVGDRLEGIPEEPKLTEGQILRKTDDLCVGSKGVLEHDSATLEAAQALRGHHKSLLGYLDAWTRQQELLVAELVGEDPAPMPLDPAPMSLDPGPTPLYSSAHGASRSIDFATRVPFKDVGQLDGEGSMMFQSGSDLRGSSLALGGGDFDMQVTPEDIEFGEQAREEFAKSGSLVHVARSMDLVDNPHSLREVNNSLNTGGHFSVEDAAELLNLHMDKPPAALSLAKLSWTPSWVPQLQRGFKWLRARTLMLPPRSDSCLSRIITSRYFEGLSCLVILGNALYFFFSMDYAAENLDGDMSTDTLDAFELGFCVFYTIELIFRVLVDRGYYFFSANWSWNTFDFLLVGLALQEQILFFAGSSDLSQSNLTYLRALRLLKMLKVLRLVRLMKSLTELRLIVRSIMGSMRAMQWSVVFVGGLTYLAALLFMQGTISHLRDNPDSDREGFEEHWSSVGQSMLSLYMSMTGGVDWRSVAQPLREIDGPYYAFFILYTAFYIWVLANTLTSLFVESTMRNSVADQSAAIQEHLQNKEMYVKMLRNWFDKLNKNKDGQIEYDDFCDQLQDPAMNSFAAVMDIELTDVRQFFLTLSADGTHPVDLDTFVVGCIKLKGTAKSVDLMELIHHQARAMAEQREFVKWSERQFRWLRKQLNLQMQP